MRFKTITSKDPGQNPLVTRNYQYSPASNITGKNTEHGNYTYQYDNLYRLTQTDNPILPDESYTYDSLGNRLTSASSTGNWTYNANNELVGYDNNTFAYDANGNTTQKKTNGVTTKYIYDTEDRLTEVWDASNNLIATYYYDPFGRRLWKKVGGVKTYFHYADEGLAAELDASGNVTKTYGYKPGSTWTTDPLFMKIGPDYYFYQNDHLGTPQKLTAVNGAVVWSAKYSSFGEADVENDTVENNLRFPGQYLDAETGLHYNWHRFYDPMIGRYLRADLIGLNGGINILTYTDSNPVNWFDPFGLCRKNGESFYGCLDRSAKEAFGTLLNVTDNLGYYGLGSAVIGAGTTALSSAGEYLAKEGIKNAKIAGAMIKGNILEKIAASSIGAKTIARIGVLKTALGAVAKVSGIIGASATAGSVGLRAIFIGNCMEKCEECL